MGGRGRDVHGTKRRGFLLILASQTCETVAFNKPGGVRSYLKITLASRRGISQSCAQHVTIRHQTLSTRREFSRSRAGGGVGERWRGRGPAALPVGDGALLGGETPEDAAEPREHGEAAVLELLDLELLEVTGPGEAGGQAATGDTSPTVSSSKTGSEAGAVFRGPTRTTSMARTAQRRGSRALGGEGSDGAGELVRDGGAVVGGVEGTGGEQGMPVPFSAAQARSR